MRSSRGRPWCERSPAPPRALTRGYRPPNPMRRTGRTLDVTPGELIGTRPGERTILEGSGVPGSAVAPVTLRVLGTLEAVASGVSPRLGGPTQRAVLARILVAGNVPVSAERLVEDVWGGRAAPDAVHPLVSRLRKVLGRDAIPQRRGGYVLDRDLVTVDADLFVAEVDDGRRALARGADADAAVLLESALDRWNGERAFAGVADVADLVVVDAEADRLEELRVAAAEALADAHMRLG